MRGVMDGKSRGKKNIQTEARNEKDGNKRTPAVLYCNTDK